MKYRNIALLALLGVVVAAPLLPAPASAAGNGRLTLATWNAEWMMMPATFDKLAVHCLHHGERAGGDDRTIYCDMIPHNRWSDADLARLRHFAARVDADVVAMQETDGPVIAARLFPGRNFCFTARRHVQNVGFAIRRGIPFTCNADYRQLGLANNDVRWGADLTLYPGTPKQVRLLAVHLKSGCNRDLLTTDRIACHELQEQAPVLEAWIDARAAAGQPFAVIGDFNRRFDIEPPKARDAQGNIIGLWPEIDDGEPAGLALVDPDPGKDTTACRQQDPVRPAIDHILLGGGLARALVPGSYRMWTYPRGHHGRWPDHCIRSVRLDLNRLAH